MTIGELRRLLENYPDHVKLLNMVQKHDADVVYQPVYVKIRMLDTDQVDIRVIHKR
jgi:hypothetical protein